MDRSNMILNGKEVIFEKCKYKCKFEIHVASWNPVMDLLALASKKGELIVKRALWKTEIFKCWSQLLPFTTQSYGGNSSDNLSNICWSPDGEILLVTFVSGKMFYLDSQTGKPLFYHVLDFTPGKLFWVGNLLKEKFENHFDSLDNLISANDFTFNVNGSRTHTNTLVDMEMFCKKQLKDSLDNTLLCITNSDPSNHFVEILANGIVTIYRFNLNEKWDALAKASNNSNFINKIVIDGLAYFNDLTNVTFLKENNWLQMKWDFIMEDQMDMDLTNEPVILNVFVDLTDNQIFHQRIFKRMVMPQYVFASGMNSKFKDFNFVRDFWLLISTGTMPISIENFLTSETFLKDLKAANSYVDEFYPYIFTLLYFLFFRAFITGVSSCLRPAVNLYLTYLNKLEYATSTFYHNEDLKRDENSSIYEREFGKNPLENQKEIILNSEKRLKNYFIEVGNHFTKLDTRLCDCEFMAHSTM